VSGTNGANLVADGQVPKFEDVGVSAYLGAAPLIHNKTYLAADGAILATETQHSGALRMACVWYGVDNPAVDSPDVPPTS
jgi:hypothetical protein